MSYSGKSLGFFTRLFALIRKEMRQMLRDRSNLLVGFLLPLVLILLFGYGVSFDVSNVRLAIVLDDNSPGVRTLLSGLDGSRYISPLRVRSMKEAVRMVNKAEAEAILHVPNSFSSDLPSGEAKIQLLLNGVDSSTASALSGYVSGALALPSQKKLDRSGHASSSTGKVTIVQRVWFNEASQSTWYLVPGLIVLIMTLIGAFLTSLLIAREWERGTLESLFVTPVRPTELVIAKLIPYIMVGMIDLAICLFAAKYLFHVPIRGSLGVIIFTSFLYLMVSLCLGLFISGATKSQFNASQLALLLSFLPALILSGFVFDLRNVPILIRTVSHLLPATHFMGLVKTLFMVGDYWPFILRDSGILSLYVVVFVLATRWTLRKRLD